MEPTTFKELGLSFEFDPNCMSCQDGNCHNRVQSTKGDLEYSVHISTNRDYTFFSVLAEENSNTDTTNTINKYFTIEKEAVKFLCETFVGFKCY